jgi:hypothetical protein
MMSQRTIHSTAELKAALFDLVGAAGNLDREDAKLGEAEDMLHDAITVPSAWQERVIPVLQALTVDGDILYLRDNLMWCIFCNASGPFGQLIHLTQCPVVLARALMNEAKITNENDDSRKL